MGVNSSRWGANDGRRHPASLYYRARVSGPARARRARGQAHPCLGAPVWDCGFKDDFFLDRKYFELVCERGPKQPLHRLLKESASVSFQQKRKHASTEETALCRELLTWVC